MTTRSVNPSVAAMIRYWGNNGCARFMNCGTTASKNTVPLGLTALIIQARNTMERRVMSAPSSDLAAIGVAGARHCVMPNQTRYATPSHLTARKAVFEVATSAPSPRPTTMT
jgi:hypothetical protein